MTITYTLNIINTDAAIADEYYLSAKSDTAARTEAAEIIAEKDMTNKIAHLCFFRSSDSCNGEIDL